MIAEKMIFEMKSENERRARPARRNTGQQRYEKKYSHLITTGWKTPILKKDESPSKIP